jgi:hypothetical protein
MVGVFCYGSDKSGRRKMAVHAHLLRSFLKAPSLFGFGVALAKPGRDAFKLLRDPLEFRACAIQPVGPIAELRPKEISHCETVPWVSTVVPNRSIFIAIRAVFSA